MALTEEVKVIKSEGAPTGRDGLLWVNPYGNYTERFDPVSGTTIRDYVPVLNLWGSSGYKQLAPDMVQWEALTGRLESLYLRKRYEGATLYGEKVSYRKMVGDTFARVEESLDVTSDNGVKEVKAYTTEEWDPLAGTNALTLGDTTTDHESGDVTSSEVALYLSKRLEASPEYVGMDYEGYLRYNDDAATTYKILTGKDIPDWGTLVHAGDIDNFVEKVFRYEDSSREYSGWIYNIDRNLGLFYQDTSNSDPSVREMFNGEEMLGQGYIELTTYTRLVPTIGDTVSGLAGLKINSGSQHNQKASIEIITADQGYANPGQTVTSSLLLEPTANTAFYMDEDGVKKALLHEGNAGDFVVQKIETSASGTTSVEYHVGEGELSLTKTEQDGIVSREGELQMLGSETKLDARVNNGNGTAAVAGIGMYPAEPTGPSAVRVEFTRDNNSGHEESSYNFGEDGMVSFKAAGDVVRLLHDSLPGGAQGQWFKVVQDSGYSIRSGSAGTGVSRGLVQVDGTQSGCAAIGVENTDGSFTGMIVNQDDKELYHASSNDNKRILDTDDLLDYSEDEQATGRRWLDGKMIYQRTFVIQETMPSGWQVGIILDPTTPYSHIIKSESSAIRGGDSDYHVEYTGFAFDNSTPTPDGLQCWLNNSNPHQLYYNFCCSAPASYKIYITVWYTRTDR